MNVLKQIWILSGQNPKILATSYSYNSVSQSNLKFVQTHANFIKLVETSSKLIATHLNPVQTCPNPVQTRPNPVQTCQTPSKLAQMLSKTCPNPFRLLQTQSKLSQTPLNPVQACPIQTLRVFHLSYFKYILQKSFNSFQVSFEKVSFLIYLK